MTKIETKTLAKRAAAVLSTLALFAVYQNCSKIGFIQQEANSYRAGFSSGRLEIEGGRSATNKHLLDVTIVGLNPQMMDQMRIANKKDMIGDVFPASAVWRPFSQQFQYELGDDYASDGSKDDDKTLVVEVRPQTYADIQDLAPFSGTILLDTLPPQLALDGVLKLGLNGATYNKGQSMAVDWNAADVVAPTGKSSGLDPNASIQVGWVESEDCSKITSGHLSALGPDDANARKFVWPQDAGLQPLYVCVFAQDRAGNRTTGLSQPMNNIWRVIAGDNNQGNGGSWKAANVRFSYPMAAAVDSKDNLYVYDNDFMNVRKVTPAGMISSYLGNGQTNSSLPVTDQFNSPLPLPTISLAMDSKDRLYYGNGRIYRFTVNEADHSVQSEYLVAAGLSFTVRVFSDGIEYLVFSTLRSVGDSLGGSYVYKVPLSAFDSLVLPVSEDSLASYRVAGSGTINAAGSPVARQQDASTAILPLIRAVKVDDNDDIYLGGSTDGQGYRMGEAALLMVRGGKVYKLTSGQVGPQWTSQIELVTLADGSRYALCAGVYGLMAVKLNLSNLPVTSDLPVTRVSAVDNLNQGIAQLHQRVGGEPVTYGFNQNLSKVIKYQGLTAVDSYGRDVYKTGDSDALAAIINGPSGIAEDPAGNIYIMEALSDIIRKLDVAGRLSLFAGTPFTSAAPSAQVGKSPSAALLATETYSAGYRFPLTYDDANKTVIAGLGATGEVLYLPTEAGKTVTRLSAAPMPPTSLTASDNAALSSVYKDKNLWPIFDLRLIGTRLIADRVLPVVPFREQIFEYTGNSARAILGNEVVNRSMRAPSSTTNFTGPATDVALRYYQPMAFTASGAYLSGTSGILSYDGTNVAAVSGTASGFASLFSAFDVTSDASGRQFLIGVSGNDVAAAILYPDGTAKRATLCMPGSFTTGTFVRIARDGGSILISDTAQRRVVRYSLRANGQIQLYQKTSNGCSPLAL